MSDQPSPAGPALAPEAEGLAFLLGTWTGDGTGVYPTISPFTYTETSVFGHVGRPFLTYVQRSIRHDLGVPAHGESGYLRPAPGGRVELMLGHTFGLVELAEGTVEGTRLELASSSSVAAPRPRRSPPSSAASRSTATCSATRCAWPPSASPPDPPPGRTPPRRLTAHPPPANRWCANGRYSDHDAREHWRTGAGAGSLAGDAEGAYGQGPGPPDRRRRGPAGARRGHRRGAARDPPRRPSRHDHDADAGARLRARRRAVPHRRAAGRGAGAAGPLLHARGVRGEPTSSTWSPSRPAIGRRSRPLG